MFAQAWVHCDNKARQIGLTHDYKVTFAISPLVNVIILQLKYQYRARSESHFACYSHCYVTGYPSTSCRLTIPVVKGGCARDALPHTYNIGQFRNLHKRCQWLAWLHALSFVTHEVTWRRSYVALLSPLLWKNWCYFPSKSTQWCHNIG